MSEIDIESGIYIYEEGEDGQCELVSVVGGNTTGLSPIVYAFGSEDCWFLKEKFIKNLIIGPLKAEQLRDILEGTLFDRRVN